MPRVPVLRGLVRGMLSVRIAAAEAVSLCTVPHPSLVLSFQIGEPLGSREREGVVWRGNAVTGLRHRAVDYQGKPGTKTLVALVSPAGAWALFAGLPPGELAGQRVALDDVLSRCAWQQLHERLAGKWEGGAVGELESWLARQVVDHRRSIAPDAMRAFAAFERGRTFHVRSVDELANHAGVSRRQLERDCIRWLGVSPKQILSARRVRESLRLLHAGLSPAAVASRVGFTDQAHLTHGFRRILGRTPGACAMTRLTDLGAAYERAGGELVTL